jgi:hypothetical protein
MIKERRKEERKTVDSINLPFLGSKEENHLCFEYSLIDLSKTGLKIAIYKCVASREPIKKDDIINFHLPYAIDNIFYDQGKVAWIEWDNSVEAQVFGVSFDSSKPIPYPYSLPVTQKENTLVSILKDMVFLKKGVFIYLSNLIPYFSHFRMEYPQLKTLFLDDVKNKVGEHHVELENTFANLKNDMTSISEITKFIDLEGLRLTVESEIYADIFTVTFSDERIMPYLNAIKKLEDRLYFDYNIIVILYVNSL